MGYRSEVCIGLTDDASRLLRTMVEHIPTEHEIHSLLKDAESNHHKTWSDQHRDPNVDCEQKLYWDYVKWYEGYECVDFIESFLSDCIPEEDYLFVRIGEDDDDIDRRGEFYDAEVYISRSISW